MSLLKPPCGLPPAVSIHGAELHRQVQFYEVVPVGDFGDGCVAKTVKKKSKREQRGTEKKQSIDCDRRNVMREWEDGGGRKIVLPMASKNTSFSDRFHVLDEVQHNGVDRYI